MRLHVVREHVVPQLGAWCQSCLHAIGSFVVCIYRPCHRVGVRMIAHHGQFDDSIPNATLRVGRVPNVMVPPLVATIQVEIDPMIWRIRVHLDVGNIG